LRIGIIADTHDNLPSIVKAIDFFNKQKVYMVFHAGDFVSPFAAGEFMALQMGFTGVFGNNDGDKLLLISKLKNKGDLYEDYYELELTGKKIVLMHQPKFLEALIASRRYDLIVYGHTHQVYVQQGPPLVVNPGECCGWTTGLSTVAIVDLAIMKADIHTL